MQRARIVGVGGALPPTVLPNASLEAELGVEPGWIEARTGIRSRRVLLPHESIVDLVEVAARRAIEEAGLQPAALDAVICATTSAPWAFPSLACLLHGRLLLGNQPAFDLAAACAGFSYALSIGEQSIRVGQHQRVLVVGADALSRACDPKDRNTRALFGDGAGAAVLAAEPASSSRGILGARLRAQGANWPMLTLPARSRASADAAAAGDPWMRMNGQEVFRFAVENLVSLTREVLAESGIENDAVDLVVPHQANLRIIRMAALQLGIDETRFVLNLESCGNTSAASIPLALGDALAAGRLKPGQIVVLNAVGGGMTAGAAVLRW